MTGKITPTALLRERHELLNCWSRPKRIIFFERLADAPDQCHQIQQLSLTACDWTRTSSLIRQFHDKLGFKAKGFVDDGGLCAGAIYRTTAFVREKTRSGAKNGQTVHIEHTVPVRELTRKIRRAEFRKSPWLVWFLMKYSITTGLRKGQEQELRGCHRTTDALDYTKPDYNYPFGRYRRLGDPVWNVWTKQPVHADYSFDDHLRVIVSILRDIGALGLADALMLWDSKFRR